VPLGGTTDKPATYQNVADEFTARWKQVFQSQVEADIRQDIKDVNYVRGRARRKVLSREQARKRAIQQQKEVGCIVLVDAHR